MKTKRSSNNLLTKGLPRVPVQEIECVMCGGIFGQTAYEKRGNRRVCPDCNQLRMKIRKSEKPTPNIRYRGTFDVVLPKVKRAYYNKSTDEWYMKVGVRKKNSKEPLKSDKIYIGVKGRDADPEKVNAAFAARYASLVLSGRSSNDTNGARKAVKLLWNKGEDRNLGIIRATVKRVKFKSHLPSVLEDKKKVHVGTFSVLSDARDARDKMYKEIASQQVPCSVCGVLPAVLHGVISHITPDCPNKVRLPTDVRLILQSKLWNLVFSRGEGGHNVYLSKDDLHRRGYLYKSNRSGFRIRYDVLFDFSLAKNYIIKEPPIDEEEVMFE